MNHSLILTNLSTNIRWNTSNSSQLLNKTLVYYDINDSWFFKFLEDIYNNIDPVLLINIYLALFFILILLFAFVGNKL